MKLQKIGSLVALTLITLSLSFTTATAQGRPPKQKPQEPKNEIGLTEKQTADAKAFAKSCIQLAKSMADEKKTLNDLSADDRKAYNECEKIWKELFTDLLARYRKAKLDEATKSQSGEVLQTSALLLIATPELTQIVHEAILESGIEGDIVGFHQSLTEILLELLDTADSHGYSLPDATSSGTIEIQATQVGL